MASQYKLQRENAGGVFVSLASKDARLFFCQKRKVAEVPYFHTRHMNVISR